MPEISQLSITLSDTFSQWRDKINAFITNANEVIQNTTLIGDVDEFAGVGTTGIVTAPKAGDQDKLFTSTADSSGNYWNTGNFTLSKIPDDDNTSYPVLLHTAAVAGALTKLWYNPSVVFNEITGALTAAKFNSTTAIDGTANTCTQLETIPPIDGQSDYSSGVINHFHYVQMSNPFEFLDGIKIPDWNQYDVGASRFYLNTTINPFSGESETDELDGEYNGTFLNPGDIRGVGEWVLSDSNVLSLVNTTCIQFPISPVTIEGPDTAVVGGNISFTLSATHGITTRTIDHFLVEFNGTSHELSATDGKATFNYLVPAEITPGEYTISATAFDSYGDMSKRTAKTVMIGTGFVNTPTIQAPEANGLVAIYPSEGSITMVSSAFSATATDTHIATDWKITSDSAGNTVIAQALNSTDLTSHAFTGLSISEKTTWYFWCRHQGQVLGWSQWASVSTDVIKTRYGEIITANPPSSEQQAVIIGSYASGGLEPWNIRGRRVWLAVYQKDKASDISRDNTGVFDYYLSSYPFEDVFPETAVFTTNSLNNYAPGLDGQDPGNFLSSYTTEAQMDAAFNDMGTSEEIYNKIADYVEARNSSTVTSNFNNSANAKAHIVRTDNSGNTVTFNLPSIDALMRVFQARDIYDAVCPMVPPGSYPVDSFMDLLNNNNSIIISSAYSVNEACSKGIGTNGDPNNDCYNWNRYAVLPVAEIPADEEDGGGE